MDFQKARDRMVEEQIAARGISDAALLEVMRRVPREKFVPLDLVHRAYDDCPLPIGEGQTISQPYIVALMTQCLKLDKQKVVLEIGTGSGYQTAVLAQLCKQVYSLERIAALGERARRTLEDLQYTGIKIFLGDGTLGLAEEYRPFDGVIVTAASPARPGHLLDQLAVGGRLVVPVGDRSAQRLMVYERRDGCIVEEAVCGCMFVPLIGVYGWGSLTAYQNAY
jgi:protein-L-isoaspartate(D-aspartate) O-methyltransferase